MNNIKMAVLALAVTLFLPTVVRAQTCTQGGTPLCGGCTAYNIIYDPGFAQTSCTKWSFNFNARRASSGTMCSTWNAPFGQFYGPMNGISNIRQTTTALNDSLRNHFYFDYTVDITDSTNSTNTWVAVYILQPNGTWYTVDTPAHGSRYCDSRSIDLGTHSDWVGQSLVVEFDANAVSGATVDITNVALWQDYH